MFLGRYYVAQPFIDAFYSPETRNIQECNESIAYMLLFVMYSLKDVNLSS